MPKTPPLYAPATLAELLYPEAWDLLAATDLPLWRPTPEQRALRAASTLYALGLVTDPDKRMAITRAGRDALRRRALTPGK